ncbi:MAG: hypothetical protein ACT4N5_07370 [Nitrosopumilaceae archaeon]
MMLKFTSRKRRGLASIVGTLFFIVIMVAAFTALLAAFSYQNQALDSQTKTTDLQVSKAQEKFYVTGDIDGVTDTLFVTIKNQGANPVEIVALWVVEKGDDFEALKYDLNSSPALDFEDVVIPIGTTQDLTRDVIPLDPAIDYSIKVVSKLGTVVTLDVPDTTIPPGPPGVQGTSCWDLDEDGVEDLDVPATPTDEDTDDDGDVDVFDCLGNTPGPAGLACWDLDEDGVKDLDVPATPTDEDRDDDGFVDVFDCLALDGGGSGEEVIIELGFINKPELFMVFPSPFGDAGSASSVVTNVGLWEAVIANPTDADMYVSKVVIVATSPKSSTTDKIFQESGSAYCTPTKISPSGVNSGSFSCTSENQLFWRKTAGTQGILIPERSAVTFSATVNAGTYQCPDLEAFNVAMTVFTTKGQFGKTGYISSARCNEGPHANLYLTDTTDTNLAILDSHMFGDKTVTTEVPNDYYIALADLNAYSTTNYINANTRVTINVPPDFEVIDFVGLTQTGWQNLAIDTINDGSTVLTADLVNNLGQVSSREAKVLHFQAKHLSTSLSPPITLGGAKLYVFIITADGDSTPGPFQVGPLAEIVVKVNP